MQARGKTDEGPRHADSAPAGRTSDMKQDGKRGKNKKEVGRPMKCPFFKQYYVGVCSGHTFPYAPSLDERKQYCTTEEFQLCLIYEQYYQGGKEEE